MLICELMSKDLHRHLHTLKIMGYLIYHEDIGTKNNNRFNIMRYAVHLTSVRLERCC